jgi:uncharacterized protein
MRYLSVPEREAFESRALPLEFGKRYEPLGSVGLRPDVRLTRPGVEIVELDGEDLAIAPETASWAFLNSPELRSFQRLDGATPGELEDSWPRSRKALYAFLARLFRRGLIAIDGRDCVDPTIFRDSPNVREGHLVELLVTERCNLGCTYCLAGTHARMPRMTPDVARKTVDLAFAMREAPAISFEFSGGEPFLEFPLMRELVEYIHTHPDRRGRRAYLNVQTNCTLLDEERVEWLRENEVRVGVSLDGDPESHNVSRPSLGGGESFSRLVEGLDLLQRHGVPFGALVVLNRSNVGSAQRLADFLLENGIYSFKLNPVAYLGTARGNWDHVGLAQEEVVAYFQELVELVAVDGYPLLEDNLRTMCGYLVSKQRGTRCLRTHCGAGDTFQAIAASGDVYPCGRATQSPGLRLGNVLEDGMTSLSAPARFSRVIAEIRERRPSGLDGCPTCHYRQMCQAGCSAQAFERYGTVRHRTPECHFYKTMYPYLMRRLTFDTEAVATFSALGYFGGEAFVAGAETLAPAAVPA